MGPLGASWRMVEDVSTESHESAKFHGNRLMRESQEVQSQCNAGRHGEQRKIQSIMCVGLDERGRAVHGT